MGLKSRMRSAVKKQNLPSNSPNASLNRAGGVAFEINDPATKLITMTGGSFFAEPRYYEGELAAKRVTAGKGAATSEKFNKLAQRIQINQDHLAKADVDEVTKEILRTASEIAEGPNPEDLLIIARWLRHEMNIRATPQALLVVASRLDSTKPFVRKYAPVIAVRPDEIKTCMLMHRFFFGMKSIKNCLAQGLSDAMSKFNERALLKYDSTGWPTWKDALQVLPRGNGRPLSKELAAYFLKGEVIDPQATPVVAARKELAKMDTFNMKAKELAEKSMVNWEVLLSQFGTDASAKTAVWTYLIEKELLGYMALMRNLRNILQAGVNGKALAEVSRRIADRDEVLRSKQLPFRFLSAYNSLATAGRIADEADMSEILAAVKLASNVSAENISIPGVTAIFADGSGSMTSAQVSDKSTVTCAQAAGVMAGIAAKSGEKTYLFEFASDVRAVRFSKTDTVLDIAAKVATGDGVNGHGTEAWKIPHVLMERGLTPDRVVILSDMQCWNRGSSSGWGYSNRSSALCDTWAKYVASSKDAKNTWLHCVHLNGYGDSPVDEGAHVNQVGAFSEKIFGMLLDVEGARGEDPVPTIEQIRQNWQL